MRWWSCRPCSPRNPRALPLHEMPRCGRVELPSGSVLAATSQGCLILAAGLLPCLPQGGLLRRFFVRMSESLTKTPLQAGTRAAHARVCPGAIPGASAGGSPGPFIKLPQTDHAAAASAEGSCGGGSIGGCSWVCRVGENHRYSGETTRISSGIATGESGGFSRGGRRRA